MISFVLNGIEWVDKELSKFFRIFIVSLSFNFLLLCIVHRSDTPKALRRLTEDCIKYNRDERPLFRQIHASLEGLLRNHPKISRSTSEPNMNRTHLQSDDFIYTCSSPKTPVHFGQGHFLFYPTGTGNI